MHLAWPQCLTKIVPRNLLEAYSWPTKIVVMRDEEVGRRLVTSTSLLSSHLLNVVLWQAWKLHHLFFLSTDQL